MSRVLGLDIGSYAVKAVFFETSMRGYTVRDVASVRRAQEGDRNETLKAAIGELFAQHPMQADQMIVALPGPTLATHAVTLPFSDPKKVEQTLPFELEGQLPFDLSEIVYDYQVGQAKEKKADLVVGVLKKDELRQLLATLAEAKVDPRVITHPGLAYQNAMPLLPPLEDPNSSVAIVDIGHERTSVALGTPGGPLDFARTFSGGGRDLTRALATEFQIPYLDAEKWKEQHGALASAVVGPDAQRAAGAFLRGMQGLVRELRQTMKAHAARTRRPVSRIYLAGGTARLPGLDEQLRNDLGIPVERLPISNEVAARLAPDEQPSIAQAYVLALRGMSTGAKAPRFNLRRGEFGFKGDFDYVREKVGRLAAFAATLLVLLIASGVVRNHVLSSKEEDVDQLLCETTEKVLGRCEKNYDVALNLLQGTESPAAAVPKVSAVTLLAELTQRIPGDGKVVIGNINVRLDRITLRAETENTKQVDAVTSAIKSYRCFKEVQQGKVERTRDGQKVTFNLDIQVECPADAAMPQG